MANQKKGQPHYSEAKRQAIREIREDLHNDGKVFIAFNTRRTIVINIMIAELEERR